jgi:hypothetical protein
MIITELNGGLGNQMFQYAAGLALATKHAVELKINLQLLDASDNQTYSLNHFHINALEASSDEINRYSSLYSKVSDRVFRPYFRRKRFYEQSFCYDRNFVSASSDTMLSGYWQSEKYFSDFSEIIRQEFRFKTPPTDINTQLAEEIQGTNSVSLHIRRGDYVTNKTANRIHGTCELPYYDKCIERITTSIVNPVFFVFSDDPDWATQNLRLRFSAHYINHNYGDRSFEDMRLMSLCKHNIIANSTFSWWAAWLNSNPEKMVFAPQKWFNDPTRDTRDLTPQGWQRI